MSAGPEQAQDRRATGELLFARYAYPPNELGYCGLGDGHELLDLAAGPGGDKQGPDDVATRARHFEGAWAYLEIIASSMEIDDPLDSRVVEAYWVGNELLDAVDPAYFAEAARRTFASQSGADWGCLEAARLQPATPHHSFHVFAIYPWMGMLRKGRGGPAGPGRDQQGPALTVLDRCRIRWGQVIARDGDHVEVSCQPLTWDGEVLGLGDPHTETVRWAESGRSLSAAPLPGEWVALHWDWLCDRLTVRQLDELRRFTLRQLALTNRTATYQTER